MQCCELRIAQRNTSRNEKMISRMAQVNAVMTSKSARDVVVGGAGDINKRGSEIHCPESTTMRPSRRQID